jgi:hypothetical protein
MLARGAYVFPILDYGEKRMLFIDDIASDYAAYFGQRHLLPEYRQLEMYSKKKKLSFAEDKSSSPNQYRGGFSTSIAYAVLEALLVSQQAEIAELPSWNKYLALPKISGTAKVVAEVFRILRIYHLAWVLPAGRQEMDDGIVRISCVFERCVLSLNISPAGIELLESFVFYYLESFRQPYSAAYVEAMLIQYFSDIVAEIKGFNDNDRVLFQYRQTMPMNRHFRFDSDNPRYRIEDGMLSIDMGKMHANQDRYPIDFYLVVNDALYIIPVEALKEGKLPLDHLPRWQARSEDGLKLPECFRSRFGREENVVGMPMT